MVAVVIRTIVAQPDAEHGTEQFEVIATMLGRQLSKVETMLRGAHDDLLAFAGFPAGQWTKIYCGPRHGRQGRRVAARGRPTWDPDRLAFWQPGIAYSLLAFAALGYAAVALLLAVAGARAMQEPFLRIDADVYFSWGTLFFAPTIIAAWLLASDVVWLLAAATGRRPDFGAVLTATATAVGVGTLATLLPDLVTWPLRALGVIDERAWEASISQHTGWFVLIWVTLAVYVLLFLVVFPLAVRHSTQLRGPARRGRGRCRRLPRLPGGGVPPHPGRRLQRPPWRAARPAARPDQRHGGWCGAGGARHLPCGVRRPGGVKVQPRSVSPGQTGPGTSACAKASCGRHPFTSKTETAEDLRSRGSGTTASAAPGAGSSTPPRGTQPVLDPRARARRAGGGGHSIRRWAMLRPRRNRLGPAQSTSTVLTDGAQVAGPAKRGTVRSCRDPRFPERRLRDF